MSEHSDNVAIRKALRAVPVSPLQVTMAWLIYHSEAGLDQTLEFINGLEGAGLLPWQNKPRYEQLRLRLL